MVMFNKYQYISISGIRSLIGNEILAAKGAISVIEVEEYLKFFTTKDAKELAQYLIDREDRRQRCTVFTGKVFPINDAVRGIKAGNFNWMTQLKPELIELSTTNSPKIVSIVIPDETIVGGKEAEYLFKLRKQPLEKPLNYLLGLMATKETKDFSERLIDHEIIALPRNLNDLHKYPGRRDDSYLVAVRFDEKERGIYRALGDPDHLPGRTGILCEDLL